MKRNKSYAFFNHLLGEGLCEKFDDEARKNVYKYWRLENFRSERRNPQAIYFPTFSLAMKNSYNKKEAIFIMKKLYDETFPMWIRKGVSGTFIDVNGTYGGGEIKSFTKEEQLDMMDMDSLKEKQRFRAKILQKKTGRRVKPPSWLSVKMTQLCRGANNFSQKIHTFIDKIKDKPVLYLFWRIILFIGAIGAILGVTQIFS